MKPPNAGWRACRNVHVRPCLGATTRANHQQHLPAPCRWSRQPSPACAMWRGIACINTFFACLTLTTQDCHAAAPVDHLRRADCSAADAGACRTRVCTNKRLRQTTFPERNQINDRGPGVSWAFGVFCRKGPAGADGCGASSVTRSTDTAADASPHDKGTCDHVFVGLL